VGGRSLEASGSVYRLMVGSSEHSNEPSGFTKGKEISRLAE